MIRKIFSSKKGEGYVDICIATVIFVMLTVIGLNIFSFITLKNDMDQIADDLIVVATHTGQFGDEFWSVDENLVDDYFYYEISHGADEYFSSDEKVQLGDRMWVEVWTTTNLKGLGVFEIPVTVRVKRSGISEVYFK